MTTLRTVDDITADLVAAIPTGATVPVIVGHRVPASGYVVAVPDLGLVTRRGNFHTREVVARWVAKVRERAAYSGHFLGVWTDGADVYWDVSRVYAERVPALEAARAASELAVWDLAAGQEVRA